MASNISLTPAASELSNPNLTLSINISESVSPIMSEVTELSLLTTNLSNSNLSSFSNVTDTHILVASLDTEPAPETIQQTDHTLRTILSALIFAKENLEFTSNDTQTKLSTDSIIGTELQNATGRTDDTLVSIPVPSDELNVAVVSEPNLSQLSAEQDVFAAEPTLSFIQQTFNTTFPTNNMPKDLNQSVPSFFDFMTTQPIENLLSETNVDQTLSQPLNSTQGTLPLDSLVTTIPLETSQPISGTLSLITLLTNISNESLPQLFNNMQEAFPLDSVPTELPSATLQPTLDTLPPILPSTNLSNESSPETLNVTQETLPLDSLPPEISPETIWPTPGTQIPITLLTNISSESLPQLLNNTQEAFPFDSIATELPFATMQPTVDTIPSITPFTNLSNQNSPEALDTTQETLPLDSLPTRLSTVTIEQTLDTFLPITLLGNLSDQSSSAFLNGSEEGVSFDSLPTGIATATMHSTPIMLESVMPPSNISNETSLEVSASTEGAASAGSLWSSSSSTTIPDTAESFPLVTPSTNVSGETLVGLSNSTQLGSSSELLATNLPTGIGENVTHILDLTATSSSLTNTTTSPPMSNSEIFFGSVSLSSEVPSFTIETIIDTVQSSQVPLGGSSEPMSLTSNDSDVNTSSMSFPTEEKHFTTLHTVETVSLVSSSMEPNQNVSALPIDIQTSSSNQSVPTLVSVVTEQETWATLATTPMPSFPLNESLPLSINVTTTNILPISETTEVASGTVEQTDNTLEPIITSLISPNETMPSSFNETQTNMPSGSMFTTSSFITIENSINTFSSEQISASVPNQSESVLLTTVKSNEVDSSSASQPMISSTITLEQTTNNLSVTQSSLTLQNESLPSSSMDETTQAPMSTESLLSTLTETKSVGTANINNGVDTIESSSITVQVTASTPLPTLSLLTILMSSPLSESTVFSNINDNTMGESTMGSAETNFRTVSSTTLFPSEELTVPNQYSTKPHTSNLLLLLTTLISHSEVTTSSVLTINSMPTSVTEPTSFSQSLSDYSTAVSSSISIPISSISNTNPAVNNRDSTFETNIDTMNSISSSQQVSESLETTFTVTNSMPLKTMSTIISSIQSSSVTPSTLANTLSNDVTSVPSETFTNPVSSFSSISIDNGQNTMNTLSISNTHMSPTSSTPIISSSFETQTISNPLPSLNSISYLSSTSSPNINDTASTESPLPSTVNTMFLTLISTNTPPSHTSIPSSMANQTISTTTITNYDTTFLSLLLTTSGLAISNETLATRNTISSIPSTTQINSNTTNAIPSSDCVFPFRYLGQWYERCISDILNDSWCSLTVDFDRDQQWKYCRAPRVKTIGGTGNGSDCVFPYVYQGTSFSTCIYRTETMGTTKSFSLFCSVTSNLDQHGLWGYCLDYDSCYFPFIYNGNTYSDCISGPQSARWCSTTANFDRNRMWTNCPVTCDGYPQQDGNSVGFQLLLEQRPCIFKQSIARDTGLILKYYALPTCELEPLCRDTYVPLFKQIICQEDGRYNYPRTICLPTK
ncbi:unnamed protein product [Rotaria sp. Silwood1]|nr:unnamed protein product [Rotaria sp. Silwood1]